MDSERLPPRPASSTVRCYDGGGGGGGGGGGAVADGCSLLMHRSYSGTWLRSVEHRKHYEFNEGNDSTISIGDLTFQNVPRVEVENECVALRDMIATQQQSLRSLSVELEAERNASSSAANEAMSMILRLQREKAEVMMENRQFKRYADEKIAHDQEKISAMEELLYKKDQAIQSLSNEMQFYKHRMLSYGLIESESDGDSVPQFEFPPIYDYPPLKCNKVNQHHVYPEIDYDILDLEYRINQLEKSPRTIHSDGSPRNPRHFGRISTGSPSSVIAITTSESQRLTHLRMMENASDLGDDVTSTSDRIYTIDNGFSETKHVHNSNSDFDDYTNTSIDDQEIKKLYMRLYALEADRESMRQAIVSMRADDEQFVFLKEIAENLYKDKLPVTRNMIIPVKKKQSLLKRFSFISIFFKWIFSFIFGGKRVHRCKYFFGISASSVGLLMLLEKGCRVGRRRYLPSNTNP